MGEDLDPSVIQKTQQKLGKYIQKPQLTEKLLRRPPFRFLHDIVTAVSLVVAYINQPCDNHHFVGSFFPTVSGNKTIWSLGWSL